MNNARTVTLKLLRTYVTKSPSEIAGIRGKIRLSKLEGSEATSEEFEDDGIDAFESDFMNVGQSYTEHERELKRSKEQLKRYIVKNKYFKELYPRFLTYIEKDQIKKLHESNPEEWTLEKLSESFPALPETIKKILNTTWVPKSVESIIKYDNKAIENWKNFKTGKLAVDPALKEHLMKFKNRKISLTDRETLIEKFIPPKMEFPKPKSTMFSNIVKDCTNSKQSRHIETRSSLKENTDKDERWSTVIEKKNIKALVINKDDSKSVKYNREEKHRNMQKLTFNEFMKEKLNHLYDVSPEEGITLLHTYRKHIESINSENVSSNVSDDIKTQDPDQEKSVAATKDVPNENALTVNKNESMSKIAVTSDTESSNLDTYVKEWISSIDTKFEYAERIKIPRNVHKEGMTYRIKDCYYDDDGEFLYRVPGLRN